MSKNFEYTDDPADPCGLCVIWSEVEEDDVFHETAVPMMPSGPVSRVFRGIHDECADSVAMYQLEHRGDVA